MFEWFLSSKITHSTPVWHVTGAERIVWKTMKNRKTMNESEKALWRGPASKQCDLGVSKILKERPGIEENERMRSVKLQALSSNLYETQKRKCQSRERGKRRKVVKETGVVREMKGRNECGI